MGADLAANGVTASGATASDVTAGDAKVGDVTGRSALLRHLAVRVAALDSAGTTRVAVDGVDGAGKTTFAAELAAALMSLHRPVIRASVDDFHNPRAVRYRQGRQSPAGFFEDSYNYELLRSYLLDPLSPGGDGWYRVAAFDHRADRPVVVEPVRASPGAILVIDGIFLHREELEHYWDLSIFLRVSFDVTYRRMAARDNGCADPHDARNSRYLHGQLRYLDTCRPQEKATVVIDNERLEAPAILRG